jgi:hypothetical protein
MTVATLNSRTLGDVVVAVTGDDAVANRPHRYNQQEIGITGVLAAGPRPAPTLVYGAQPDYTAVAAWSAARDAADTAIDTAALSWAR